VVDTAAELVEDGPAEVLAVAVFVEDGFAVLVLEAALLAEGTLEGEMPSMVARILSTRTALTAIKVMKKTISLIIFY
jgi:hypothetical protein